MSATVREPIDDAADLDATAARAAVADGRLTPTALAEACLARIAAGEAEVQAWTFLDPPRVRRQAEALERGGPGETATARRAGRREGHLRHGRHADRERHAAACRASTGS